MALPSLDDVVFVLVLLMPGFISLTLFRRILALEKKISEFELVIWSVLFSLLIYAVYGWYNGMTDVNVIKNNILQPERLVAVLGLSLVIGVVPSVIMKRLFRRNVFCGQIWNTCMRSASKEGSWVTVFTSDGKEYKGSLHYSGGEGSPNEITIRKPKLILRDSKGYLEEEVDIGQEVLFNQEDIKRIVFFREV